MKNRKLRILSALLALAMLLALVPTAAFAAGDDGYTLSYRNNSDGTVTVTGYTGTINGAVTIPAKINEKTVTEIGVSAFIYCHGMTSLVIPGSVKTIGTTAFYGCDALKSITLEEGVEAIGTQAFINCSKLTSIKIPASVKTIGDSAFYGCGSLETVTLENGVEKIDQQAFANCSKITHIEIPASVKTIGTLAFSGCKSLEAVTVPGSVTAIGSAAFSGCSSLETVTLQEGIKTIGTQAFENCSKITSIVIPKSVTTIGVQAFVSNKALRTVYFTPGSQLEAVASSAFIGCSNLESIYYEEDNNINWGNSPVRGSPWVVSFDTDGGSGVAEQFVKNKLRAERPAEDPTKEGYQFAGWYADKDCTQPFDFENTAITGKTNVYAKWSLVWSPMEKARYKLTLADCTAEVDGKEVESGAYVQADKTVTLKLTASVDNMKFGGFVLSKNQDTLQYDPADPTKATFTMPEAAVDVTVQLNHEDVADDGLDAASVITGVAVGTGTAVLAYHIGTELYAEQVLGAGVAVPKTRGDVALKAWELAGKPAVENAAVAPEEAAQAQQWVLESGLMENQKDGTFHPEKRMGKLKALRVLEKAQKMG